MSYVQHLGPAIAVTLTLAIPALACENDLYDASLGTFPDQQGWNLGMDGPSTVSIVDEMLEISTLPFSDGSCAGPSETQYIHYSIGEAGLDFDDEPVLEARLRVNASQYGANGCENWPRPGFMLWANDIDGRTFRVGIGSSRVFLLSHPYVPFGDPNVVEIDFDTTDDYHIYRLELSADSATLLIDGVSMLTTSVSSYVATVSTAGFGDPTVWANSDVSIDWVSVIDPTCCIGDLDNSGAVDVGDLLNLLAGWGGAATDITGDGTTDVLDLLALLANWGGC